MDFELIGIGVFALCGCVFFILFLVWFQGAPPHEDQADASKQDTEDAEESMDTSSGDMDAGNLTCHSSNGFSFVKRLSRSLTAERSALIMPCILREFSLEQMEAATGEFSSSSLIKQGHSGDIYRGVLEGGEVVIIKSICMTPSQVQVALNKDPYFAEMDIYGKVLDQRFLVPVLGQCLAKEEKFLVYEYMPYGDLASILARSRAGTSPGNLKPYSLSRDIKAAEREILEAAATQKEEQHGDDDDITGIRGDFPGHCFVCGRKGHFAADCTRRRRPPKQQQVVADVEEKSVGIAVQPSQDASTRSTKQRSEVERARRRASKKRKKKFARFSEGLRVQMVYKRKDLPCVEASSPAIPLPPIVPEMVSSSSLGKESPSYETLFPTLAESCKNPSPKELRRSARRKGKV